jgi:hypothetical protein
LLAVASALRLLKMKTLALRTLVRSGVSEVAQVRKLFSSLPFSFLLTCWQRGGVRKIEMYSARGFACFCELREALLAFVSWEKLLLLPCFYFLSAELIWSLICVWYSVGCLCRHLGSGHGQVGDLKTLKLCDVVIGLDLLAMLS